MQRSNAGLFWPVLILVTAVDFWTKAIAAAQLVPAGLPHSVLGDFLRFTLVFNPGAAFGLHVGQYSRWIFMVLTIVALVILGRLYVATRPGAFFRTLSLALVCGGAIGNLIDRIHSARGVVDFIDIGFSESRWPTFNIADMAVSLGAFFLACVLWSEDTEPQIDPAATPATAPGSVPTAGSAATITAEPRELS